MAAPDDGAYDGERWVTRRRAPAIGVVHVLVFAALGGPGLPSRRA